nr:GNAT family N-acetyltransferase [Actinokineospora iranica]
MTVRAYRDEDREDIDRLRRLVFRSSTGVLSGGWRGLVGELDRETAGFLRIWDYRQFFGGVAVPTGGVASVAVYPHARGRGVAGALLSESLRVMREAGQVIAALYPYVLPLYRRHGWEHVGTVEWATVPLVNLAATPRAPLPVRPATPADLPDLHACYLRTAATVDGMLDRAEPGSDHASVFGADLVTVAPGPEGLRGYLTADRPDDARLVVKDLVADDVEAAHVLLRQLASWAGLLTEAEVRVFDAALLDHLVPGALTRGAEVHRFMLRVVDLPAAVAARGWPAVAHMKPFSVDIEVTDPTAPWNTGRWRLGHDGSSAFCEPGGTGEVHLHARALGPWFAGSTTAHSLRRAGLLSGRPTAALLDALTGAPHPVRLSNTF